MNRKYTETIGHFSHHIYRNRTNSLFCSSQYTVSIQALQAMAESNRDPLDDTVVCPVTKESYSFSKVKKVHVIS